MNEAMKPDVSLTLFEFLPYCKASVTLYVSLGFTWPDYLFGPDFLRGNPGHFLLCELLPGKYVHFIFHLCSGQNKISWSKIPSSHLEKWKSEETASWISQRYDRNAFKENITYLFFLFDELQFMTDKFSLTVFSTGCSLQRFHRENKTDSWFWQRGNWHVRQLTKPKPNDVLDVSIVSYDYLQPLSENSQAKSRAAGGLLTECMFILKCVSSQKAGWEVDVVVELTVMMLSRWRIPRKLWLATEQMISY